MAENIRIVIPEFGAPEVLDFITSEIPQPKEGEVLVKVCFAALNPIDVKTRAGMGWAAAQNKDNLPWTPGYDISGKVISVGKNSSRFSEGDAVAGLVGFPLEAGGYSQYLCVQETALSQIPDTVTLQAAAALPMASQTAAQALHKVNPKKGERVLILAGAGGVGHIAVQLAVATQAEIYATCSEINVEYLTNLGAHAINYQSAAVSDIISEVDVLIDLVGGDVALDALGCLKPSGRVVTIPTITKDQICEKSKQLGVSASGMLVEPDPKQLDTMLNKVATGALKIDVQPAIPYKNVVEAHKQIETGHTRGKIVLDMQC